MGDEHFQSQLAAAIGEAVAAARSPALLRLQRQLTDVDSRVSAFVPRRSITDTVKSRHREALRVLGGRCPCCAAPIRSLTR